MVYHERRLGVQSGVGLVAEEVFGIEHDGAGYRHTLLHTSRDFVGILVGCLHQVDTVKAFLGTAHAVGVVERGKHIEWELHIVSHRHRVKECGALENHTHLTAHHHLLALGHAHEVAPVVEHLSRGWVQQSHEVLHQHRLARTALADDEVGLAGLKAGIDATQYGLVAKGLGKIFDFYHINSGFG